MYNYKLEDFATIEQNALGCDPNEIISICKRFSNKKRDFLFVNKIQAKHIPTRYKDFVSLTEKLYHKIDTDFHPHGNILIIGFAETATALSADIMKQMHFDESHESDNIWYVQTTRCDIDHDYISFSEEHSHATEQRLYLDTSIKADTIIMIDDEITTGKTIINMVNKLKAFYPDATYHCASVLNWQNEENRQRFVDNNITATALVTGCIKDNLETIDINAETPVDITDSSIPNEKTNKSPDIYTKILTGVTSHEYIEYFTDWMLHLESRINKEEKTLILGTEELMYPAIILSSYSENAVCQSTTRSPITINHDDGYAVTSGFQMHSNYGDYTTYLYDVTPDAYDKIIVVTNNVTQNFCEQITKLGKRNHIKNMLLIEC